MHLRKDAPIFSHSPSAALTDEKLMAQAFWQCLKDNQPEAAVDVIATYLEQVNKLKLSKERQIPRATLYRGLRRKNLTIKTVAKILHNLSH